MSDAWLAVLSFLFLSVVVPLSMVVAAKVLRVRARAHSPLTAHPYECGEEPAGPTWIQFHPRYYLVAMFFVLFDLEAAFLLPWASAVRALGTAGLVEAAVFAGILMAGWWYAVRKGAIEWA